MAGAKVASRETDARVGQAARQGPSGAPLQPGTGDTGGEHTVPFARTQAAPTRPRSSLTSHSVRAKGFLAQTCQTLPRAPSLARGLLGHTRGQAEPGEKPPEGRLQGCLVRRPSCLPGPSSASGSLGGSVLVSAPLKRAQGSVTGGPGGS